MFSSLAQKRKIEEATSNRDEVTPGQSYTSNYAVYLSEEIWQMIVESGSDKAVSYVEFLNRRLGSRSSTVKYKVLRLMRFICEKGAYEFELALTKRIQPIREHVHYRGEPDPFKGDAGNAKVRAAANELLATVFSANKKKPDPHASVVKGRIQGFGNTEAEVVSNVRPRNVGVLGNGESFVDIVQKISGGALNASVIDNITQKSSYVLQSIKQSYANNLSHEDSWNQSTYSYDQVQIAAPSKKEVVAVEPQTSNINESRISTGDTKALDSEDTYSKSKVVTNLVNSLCRDGGVRAQLSFDECRRFLDTIQSIDGTEVARELEKKLSCSSWQSVLRALYLLILVAEEGSCISCGKIANYFQINPSAILKCLNLPHTSIRNKANQVISRYGIKEEAKSGPDISIGSKSVNSNEDVSRDLLDIVASLSDASACEAALNTPLVNGIRKDLLEDEMLSNSEGQHAKSLNAIEFDLLSMENLDYSNEEIKFQNFAKSRNTNEAELLPIDSSMADFGTMANTMEKAPLLSLKNNTDVMENFNAFAASMSDDFRQLKLDAKDVSVENNCAGAAMLPTYNSAKPLQMQLTSKNPSIGIPQQSDFNFIQDHVNFLTKHS